MGSGNCLQLAGKTYAVLDVVSRFTQQDGRKKRTAKRLSVTNVTGLLLACFVENSLNVDVFCSSKNTSECLKECEVWRKVSSNKIIVTLVTQGLPSSFLTRPVAQVH